ncbi:MULTISPECIES: hypothetical protein [Commensalibacter]|uniref:Signal transduction histidine kinase dimerisation/phosphoacceptor domain-containing protein n=2 Tax=Commensalibacter TaxID=1079922 RepID=W7E745_9PROT|nr:MULTISPECIES: hypothetical protein [Commensalibacter]EUK18966.1 hypothetical protein COMX_04430 [Commensalibacter papalotli (ex Servin-Garciduenas et al. 2014)]CAI3924972.1 unnamed protein product [Commensalibacter papalotli (ex Botero et al. 2024)]CAI3927084.1 unnamed protein product [Commensalibacter papalotli (ex Botero et al. 2024)]
MASSLPKPLQKKRFFRYFIGISSGILLCVLTFSLYDATLPLWCIFVLMGLYITTVTTLIITGYQRKLAKIETQHASQLSILRHDVKGILSPALLMADRILLNKTADEKTLQSAESIAQSIEKVAEYLKETKNKSI